ncbi:winged helix domain-containing protein [Paragemmobacter straminiformis]|uniref:winged helix domain-containing protein n=1 Tax=Paragemmobacter straminiformis TaxID=2045119 RepID=UPI003BB1B40F
MLGADAAPNRSDLTETTARGRDAGKRDAVRDRKISPSKRQGYAVFTVEPTDGAPFKVSVKGRVRWAVERLIAAGEKGCTPLHQPAPRWSGYIREARLLGLEIETVTEKHGGDYPGHHGRYVLRCKVTQERGGL